MLFAAAAFTKYPGTAGMACDMPAIGVYDPALAGVAAAATAGA